MSLASDFKEAAKQATIYEVIGQSGAGYVMGTELLGRL